MKKKPISPPVTKHTSGQRPPAVRDTLLKGLESFHRTGLDSIERYPDRMQYGKARSEAARCGLGIETLHNARRFAAFYTSRDVEQLVSNCRKHGYGLGRSHMIRLLTLRQPKREVMQDKAIKAGWSWAKLNREIIRRNPDRRRNPGRRRHIPANTSEAYFEITRACDQWHGLSSSLRGPAGNTKPKGKPLWNGISPAIRKLIDEVDDAVSRLKKEVPSVK